MPARRQSPDNGTMQPTVDSGARDPLLPDAAVDGALPDASCEVGRLIGWECLSPDEAWCHGCGSLHLDANCQVVPDLCGAIEACDLPGPAQQDEFCGDYWWCDRDCDEGLVCVPEYACRQGQPSPQGFDWRTRCRTPEQAEQARQQACDDADAGVDTDAGMD